MENTSLATACKLAGFLNLQGGNVFDFKVFAWEWEPPGACSWYPARALGCRITEQDYINMFICACECAFQHINILSICVNLKHKMHTRHYHVFIQDRLGSHLRLPQQASSHPWRQTWPAWHKLTFDFRLLRSNNICFFLGGRWSAPFGLVSNG